MTVRNVPAARAAIIAMTVAASALAAAFPASGADQTVQIADFQFAPQTVDVAVGDTVTWVNQDSAPHTATAADGGFDTGMLDDGGDASHTFATAGVFSYVCELHPEMTGTVVVSAAQEPSETTAPTTAPPTTSPPTETATPEPTAAATTAAPDPAPTTAPSAGEQMTDGELAETGSTSDHTLLGLVGFTLALFGASLLYANPRRSLRSER